jgi:hypothetical protein
MKKKVIAIIAVLLVTGTVMQYFLSMLHTLLIPDVITAFSCLAIILFRPKLYGVLGIGIAAGFLSMLIPGSILAPANLVSGPAGTFGCYYLYELVRVKNGLSPAIATGGATLVSGFVFVIVATVFVFNAILSAYGNFLNFVAEYLPIIVLTALLNAVIVQVLAACSGRVTGKRPAPQ